ncbi:MAG: hypothetical protein ABIO70_07885 [Pseudomonadota bacterium]
MRAPALAALALLGCGESQAPDRGVQALLPALGVSVYLPPGSAVYQRPAGRWVLDQRPGMRQPRRVVLEAAEPGPLARPPGDEPGCPWEGPRVRSLDGAGTVEFYTRVGCGGSGGVEADLVGRWTLGGHVLTVACQVQEEPVLSEGPDPAFCLPLLAAARPIPVADRPAVLGPDIRGEDPTFRLQRALTPPP